MSGRHESGQSLMELIIVVGIAITVMGALTFATISSLRNATLSKNQLQATKLTQEGIEKVRSIRDRDGGVFFTYSGGSVDKFSQLYDVRLERETGLCARGVCKFILDPVINTLTYTNSATESLGNGFNRIVQITDEPAGSEYQTRKTVTVRVSWTDFAGLHESILTTILRKI